MQVADFGLASSKVDSNHHGSAGGGLRAGVLLRGPVGHVHRLRHGPAPSPAQRRRGFVRGLGAVGSRPRGWGNAARMGQRCEDGATLRGWGNAARMVQRCEGWGNAASGWGNAARMGQRRERMGQRCERMVQRCEDGATPRADGATLRADGATLRANGSSLGGGAGAGPRPLRRLRRGGANAVEAAGPICMPLRDAMWARLVAGLRGPLRTAACLR